jgi:uncharacterized protein (DUF1501 family)
MPCHPFPRREFLARGLIGTLGLALSPHAARAWAANTARADRCVLIWLNGGPSHLDTFDPKPGTPTGGPFAAIDTSVPGIRLAQHLPRLATQARHFSLIRSLSSREADHERAYQLLHTGHVPQETVAHPALGAIVARHWSPDLATLPAYVSIRGASAGPGFFGLEFAPHVINDPASPFENIAPPQGVSNRRLDRRFAALNALNQSFANAGQSEIAADYSRLNARARLLMGAAELHALDLNQASESERNLYGVTAPAPDGSIDNSENQSFARACLLARRLLERGVRFVEVILDGWDTHEDNFNQVANLCNILDQPLAALIADLAARGLLDSTLLLCMGEFGRTPAINNNTGRDHWSDAFSALIAGGGIRPAQVVGATDAAGEQVADQPVSIPDLFATLLATLGIDASRSHITPEGRPIKLVDNGTPIKQLLP